MKENGIGFTGVLTIVFIILKLCNVISWSWLWVLSPMWISLAICIIVIIIYFLYYLGLRKNGSKKTM